jgi:hypothetical protein
MHALIDLASDKFHNAPSAISIGHLMLGDRWIGWDLIVRTIIFLTVRFQEGVSRSFAIYCHYGTAAQEKYRVLSFKMKILDLALIGCVWQWLVKDIVLRVRTFSRGKPMIYD